MPIRQSEIDDLDVDFSDLDNALADRMKFEVDRLRREICEELNRLEANGFPEEGELRQALG